MGRYHLPPDEMPPPVTVLDLGANVGLTAAHYCALWPHAKVVGYELDGDCANLAHQNAPAATIRLLAVYGHRGEASYDASVRAEAFTVVHGGPDRVYAVTMDDAITYAFGPGPVVDFCKMDVEGAEWEIFETVESWGLRVRHLLVELHSLVGDMGAEHGRMLVEHAVAKLRAGGYEARHHEAHPRAVWAWR